MQEEKEAVKLCYLTTNQQQKRKHTNDSNKWTTCLIAFFPQCFYVANGLLRLFDFILFFTPCQQIMCLQCPSDVVGGPAGLYFVFFISWLQLHLAF